jgi:dihydroxy-acid dehydratase
MLYGTGLTPTDLQKPQVGICSMWWEGNTCNMHLDKLAGYVKEGVQGAGLVGLRFNTIGVSDGISMGTDGMSYSLPSRDLIADSIETVVGAQWYDAVITIPGCDKNMPGSVMAMLRLNRPSLMVYGGTIKPGFAQGKPRDVISAFQSYGEYLAGAITDNQRLDIVMHACPGAGACGGMYTANTMATAIEALGLSLPYSSSTPCRRSRQKRGMPTRGYCGSRAAAKGPEAARHRYEEIVRERPRHRYGCRRINQRSAASDCDGEGGGDRLSLDDFSARASACRCWRISSRAAPTCKRICTRLEARRR